ncbi:hypothetical protein cypCar_00022196 [Cyprinus carpio]|nr:hypothetical protein cypCar_00022196 [Cyprinus carpio]
MKKLLIIMLFFSAQDSGCWGQDRVKQPSGEMTANKGDPVTLQCNYSTTTKNAYLFWITMTHWQKYFMLFIPYFLGCRSEDAVHQNLKVQTAVEGAAVTINCSYTTTDPSPTLFWYQQKVNGFPEYMLNRLATYGNNEEEFKKRFNASLNTLTKSVPLTIQNLRCDSAVYYCALRTTVTETHSTLIQKIFSA